MRSVVQGHASPLKGVLTFAAVGVGGLILALTLLGCGGARPSRGSSTPAAAAAKPKPKATPVCLPSAGVSLARFLGAGAGAVEARAGTWNNGSPECHFVAVDGGRRVVVVVNVDPSPQPYQRLERTIVEDGQQFGTERNFSPPVTVSKLGLDAAWLPDQSKLLTTDGKALLTVSVTWRGEKPARQLALAKLAARLYLGKPIPPGAVPTGEA